MCMNCKHNNKTGADHSTTQQQNSARLKGSHGQLSDVGSMDSVGAEAAKQDVVLCL